MLAQQSIKVCYIYIAMFVQVHHVQMDVFLFRKIIQCFFNGVVLHGRCDDVLNVIGNYTASKNCIVRFRSS